MLLRVFGHRVSALVAKTCSRTVSRKYRMIPHVDLGKPLPEKVIVVHVLTGRTGTAYFHSFCGSYIIPHHFSFLKFEVRLTIAAGASHRQGYLYVWHSSYYRFVLTNVRRFLYLHIYGQEVFPKRHYIFLPITDITILPQLFWWYRAL